MFAGSDKRTELRRVRDDSDRYVHKSRAVPESGEQSTSGEYKTSSTRNPSLATQQTSEQGQRRGGLGNRRKGFKLASWFAAVI